MDSTLLLDRISRFGIARSEAELAQLARMANRLGVAPAIAGVLTDTEAPDIVRERAAARVAVAVAATPAGTPASWIAA